MTESSSGHVDPRSTGVGLRAAEERLQFDVIAEPSQLFVVRHRVRQWAETCGLDGALVAEFVFSVNEAATNAVEHAYADEVGRVRIGVLHRAHDLTAVISDSGRWRTPKVDPDPSAGGRGLMLLEHLADTVDVRHDGSGSSIRLFWTMPR